MDKLINFFKALLNSCNFNINCKCVARLMYYNIEISCSYSSLRLPMKYRVA